MTDMSVASTYLVNMLSGNDEVTEICKKLASGLHCPLNILKYFSAVIRGIVFKT